MVFRLTLHPAFDGDCVQLSWGEEGALRHLFVDLGRGATWAEVRPELESLGEIELFVMSHIDADHIAGAIPMVREDTPAFTPKRLWYNARPQLKGALLRGMGMQEFGARQAEKLSRGIKKFHWPHNAEFASGIVSTDSPEGKAPLELPGDLKLTLLSPTDEKLADLLTDWDRDLKRANIRAFDPDRDDPLDPVFERFGAAPNVQVLARTAYQRDTTKANGASIAFIAEFDGRRVLLAADAHSEVLEAALRPLAEREGGRYRIDLLKVCHHGSKANSSPALFEILDCTKFAFSTNGTRRHRHPDPETIARLLMADKEREKMLYFNYRQPSAEMWDSRSATSRWRYKTVFPDAANNGRLVIDIG